MPLATSGISPEFLGNHPRVRKSTSIYQKITAKGCDGKVELVVVLVSTSPWTYVKKRPMSFPVKATSGNQMAGPGIKIRRSIIRLPPLFTIRRYKKPFGFVVCFRPFGNQCDIRNPIPVVIEDPAAIRPYRTSHIFVHLLNCFIKKGRHGIICTFAYLIKQHKIEHGYGMIM